MSHWLRVGLVLAAVLSQVPHAGTVVGSQAPGQQQDAPADAVRRDGQSATLLPDGTWLLIGGRREGLPTSAAVIWNPDTRQTVPLPQGLVLARADHSATLLADGTVLILGGVDASGAAVAAIQRFDPASGRSETLPEPVLARSAHSATLLTDGRLLIAGGVGDDGSLRNDAAVWDPSSNTITQPIYMHAPRRGHTATLLEDGAVAIEGGADADGRQRDAETFFPENEAFVAVTLPAAPSGRAVLAGSLPIDGSDEVPVDGFIALRFSKPLRVRTVNTQTVTISGPDGQVAATVVPAEGGRLAFVKPSAPLAPGTPYQVSVAGALEMGTSDIVLQASTIHFTTAPDSSQSMGDGDREWRPDGNGWRANRPDSRWRQLPALQASPGVTAMSGQVLLLSGAPLANVTLEIDGHTAQTDQTGRFLLELRGMSAGHKELIIDGTTANRPGRTYGVFEAGLPIGAGRTNVLPFTIWMPRLDTAHAVTIPSPTSQPTVVTTPLIPGLELHLAPNTVIRDRHGKRVTELSITPIPIDRPPFPLPNGAEVPIYFTVQPGGAYVYVYGGTGTKGARLVYPNYTNQKPGETMDFWHYNPEGEGWHVYGQGAVTDNGRQVAPAPGVAIYEFTGAMISTAGSPPPSWPSPGGGPSGGDPVDLATGLFVYDKTDLFLPDVMPIALTRTYRQGDATTRAFGRGSRHTYDLDLWRPNFTYETADLILPDGGRIHYVCSNPDTPYLADLRFEHTETPTIFYKSTFRWNGNGWDLTLRDGTVYVFGDNAPLQAIRDRFGNTLRIIRGSGQTITKLISPNRWMTFDYDAAGRMTQATDNSGRTVAYTYDASGRLWKVTDVAGGVTEYTYDASHRMLTVKDPRGITYLTNQYDANGRVSQQTLANTGVFEFDYTLDGSGRVTQTDLTDPEGRLQRTTFNADGYALTNTEAYGTALARTTTFTRASDSNLPTSVVDGLSRETAYTYDTLGNLTSIEELAGTLDAVTTTYTYEPAYNQVATVTDPLNHTTTFTYDQAGQLTTVTDPLNHQTAFTYNAAGQPVTVTDALSKTTTLGYNQGNLISIASPLGHTQQRFVDGAGQLVQLTDAQGAASRFEYNAFSQVTTITDPLGGQTTFTYDGNGNLLTLTDARGKTTTWTYDSMDRVATRTDPLNRTESFAYDLNGNATSWTDRKGQVTTYQYDALNRPTFVGFGTSGAPPTYASSVTTTFDAGDRATEIVDSVAGTIERTYDLLDRLTGETTPEGTVSYTHDGASRRATMTVAGQTQVTYAFDNADRLTGITQGTAAVTMAYDDTDRRTSLTLPNGIVVEYAYDDDSRLTGLTYKQGMSTLGTLTYTYDATGQRTSVGGTYARTGLPAALASATYDDANQIATFGGTSFTYDANGNLTSDGVRSYTWNPRNELASLTGPVNGTFAYDGVGRRRSKTIGGTTTQFLYDGLNPVQELSGGTPTANLLTGLGIDEFFTRTDAAGVRNYLTDALGSSVALTDSVGAVQTEYTYEPFGSTTASGVSTGNTVGFTGREADGTGLYYYRARYYHPGTQRFIAEDPIGFEGGGTNLHAYVANAPTHWTDPTGLAYVTPPRMCQARSGKTPSAWLLFLCVQVPPAMPMLAPGVPLIALPGPRPTPPSTPNWPGSDPTKAPPDTVWKGKPGSQPGSRDGNYHNPRTGESYRPDLSHPRPHGPHWDYRGPDGSWYRVFPDGRVVPK